MQGGTCRLSVAFTLLLLGGCSGGGGGGALVVPPPHSDTIQEPTVMNLYPSTSSVDGARLFVIVTSVGTTTVSMPLAFDTGSAGITLYAPDIFPSSMVTEGGFTFAPGQSSISYYGITVTNLSGTRKYGGTITGKTETGNIGYAKVTFGDSAGSLVTAVMPVFLYYLITDNSTGQTVPVPPQRGWFGVNDAPNLIAVTGSTETSGYPACVPGTIGSCYVVSVLKYLSYGAAVNAGFMLSPFPLQSCDISAPGACSPSPMLTVGLTAALKSGFSTVKLKCPPNLYTGPDTVDGYAVCQMGISGTAVTVSGPVSGVLDAAVLFDSGTPEMMLNVPTGNMFPTSVPAGAVVQVQTPSGFSFSYTAGAAPEVTNTIVHANSNAESIIGIGYFTTNSLFVDFVAGTMGWK